MNLSSNYVDKPLISVVITAYNRKQYLLQAVSSVLNQKLDRRLYEIIVVKNFKDEEIDRFLDINEVINLYNTSKEIGKMQSVAIKIAKGEVISFLDDDDMFTPNKLSVIFRIFTMCDEIDFYHNGRIIISDHHDNMPFDIIGRASVYYIHSRKNKCDINKVFNIIDALNGSSITISRRLALKGINILEKVKKVQDLFWFWFACEHGKILLVDNRPLTIYRLHTSNISAKLDSFFDAIIDVNNLRDHFHESYQKDVWLLVLSNLLWFVIENNIRIPKNIIKNILLSMFCSKQCNNPRRLFLCMLGFLYLIEPRLSKASLKIKNYIRNFY
jgi:glycosyltransferase involved in cell wall biosynthesis